VGRPPRAGMVRRWRNAPYARRQVAALRRLAAAAGRLVSVAAALG
jgi:hypothetical protein